MDASAAGGRNGSGSPGPNGTVSGSGGVSGPVGGAGVAEPQGSSAILISFIYSVVCLVGLCGNSMVIYVILRYAKMKTATNIYILNLAIADELLMLSVPFLVTSTLLRYWPFGSLLCRLVLSADAVNMFTSIYCLTVLSVDRYMAVVHPIKASRYRRPTVAKMVNLAVWGFALVIILPIIIFTRTEANSDGTVACNMMMPEPKQKWLVVFVVYIFLMGFLLPVVAISLCYILIIAKMRMVALKAGWQQRKRSERKITLLVMMVVMVFVICWMPFYVVQLVNLFVEPDDATISQLSVILAYANSCANPILYGFLSDNFKRSFQRLLCLSWMDNGAAEEPVDYYATALKSRAYSAEDFPADNFGESAGGSPYRNGTCTSRVTTLSAGAAAAADGTKPAGEAGETRKKTFFFYWLLPRNPGASAAAPPGRRKQDEPEPEAEEEGRRRSDPGGRDWEEGHAEKGTGLPAPAWPGKAAAATPRSSPPSASL